MAEASATGIPAASAPRPRVESLYWLLPVFLVAVQAWCLRPTLNFIRYEELAESVRNPYWLRSHALYDATSSNVGWYGCLLILYELFGFSLHAARFFRLFLQVLAVFSLADLLQRHFGKRLAVVPLLVCGLSPTWLYLNLQQTSFAVDLQLLPICLWLVDRVELEKRSAKANALYFAGAWSLAMGAWLSYPAFVCLLPAVGLFSIHRLAPLIAARTARPIALYAAASLAGFVTPFAISAAWVEDHAVFAKGVFRGGGGEIVVGLKALTMTLKLLAVELFWQAHSYQFHLPQVEFSGWYPAFVVSGVLALSLALVIRASETRFFLGSAWFVLLWSIGISSLGQREPGLRRETAILAAFYALLIGCWAWLARRPVPLVRRALCGFAGLLLVHHLWVLPANRFPSGAADRAHDTGSDPAQLLADLTEKVEGHDLTLRCNGCRYSEIFALVEGNCAWNHLQCHEIYAEDRITGETVQLSVPFLTGYLSEHK